MALRVAFSDFWGGYEPEGGLLLPMLRRHTNVTVVPAADAELLFFSEFGLRHSTFVGTKVHYTPENVRPRWSAADFGIGYDHLTDARYLRFPDFAHLMLTDRPWVGDLPPSPPWEARQFCLFLYGRTLDPARVDLLDAIAQYRPVTCPGAVRRNTVAPELSPRDHRHWRRTKLAYQRGFRFTIAGENSRSPGYTTEKITDALVSRTIPIYWGDPLAGQDIRPEAFIHADDYADFAELTAYVAEVNQDPALARTYLDVEPWLVRPLDQWEADLHGFLGTVVEGVGTISTRAARERAARLGALAVATKARRAVGRVERAVGRLRSPGPDDSPIA